MIEDAKAKGFDAGRFSFNVVGGRCEHCQGAGVTRIPMNFLPDVYVKCDQCGGKQCFVGPNGDGVFLHILAADVNGSAQSDAQALALTQCVCHGTFMGADLFAVQVQKVAGLVEFSGV